MELNIRAMTPEEIKYSYSQSQQLRMQSGSIGHLRGDFGSKGYEFHTTWDDHNPRLKTDAFKSELDEVINALRSDEYGLLKNRYAMGEFKQRYPESAFTGNYTTCCGVPKTSGSLGSTIISTAFAIRQNGWTGTSRRPGRASALSTRTTRNCSASRTAARSW